ncbi:MAG: DNA-processing protein DprA [Phycisphaerales bacterium]
MPTVDDFTRDVLRLTLLPGLGPVLVSRLLAAFGTPEKVLSAPPSTWRAVKGIGPERAAAVAKALPESAALLEKELALAERLGVSLIARGSPAYPHLLDQLPDAPPLLYVRGGLDCDPTAGKDRYPVAVVGSRRCTIYGTEQAARFAGFLASAGLTIVSGGARGIDSAAHQAALRVRGRTVAVLGCGLAHVYPEENKALFDEIAGGEAGAGGAVVSELPLNTPPSAENFPARNRIISGMSLGVVVVEAGLGSGALITARLAAGEHGREVFALPDRVNAPSSSGSNELLREGAATLVLDPADVLNQLEQPARNTFNTPRGEANALANALFAEQAPAVEGSIAAGAARTNAVPSLGLSSAQTDVLETLVGPLSADDLSRMLARDAASVRADLTMLELRRLVRRVGSRFERVA